MRAWTCLGLALALAACGASDDTTDGTRGSCAAGGALTGCADTPRTAEGACWRLVDCGAIPLHADDDGIFDWGNCVDDLERLSDTGEALTIDCIATSSCDALQVDSSPAVGNGHVYRGQFACYLLGTGGRN